MRVLVTGGYGFIGSHVAETFYLEGHEVFILDNLSTGNKNNVLFKHKSYLFNVEDEKCEEVFRANKFDVVVHLAAHVDVVTSMENPQLDAKANVYGLANMLHLSKKYNVKKFVFASSAAVYGTNSEIPLVETAKCDPISPYGINKWVGELYCKKWKETFDLDTLCFRFSNVYGPKQGSVGEGGVVSIFVHRTLKNEDLHVYGDGAQTRDFIFVQDVAEAIYRAVEAGLSGLYNLSTNSEISVNELIHLLRKTNPDLNVQYQAGKPGDIKHSRLDNTRIKQELDWVPLHHFDEGLEKTVQWFQRDLISQKRSAKESTSSWMNPLKWLVPYFENAALLLLSILISTQAGLDFGGIDFRLFYLVLAAFLLNRMQSMLAIGASAVWYLVSQTQNGWDMMTLLTDQNTIARLGLYLFTGLAIGYVLDRKTAIGRAAQNEARQALEKVEALQSIYQETLQSKDELHDRLLYTDDSIAVVSKMMLALDSLNPDIIVTAAVGIVEKVTASKKVALYWLQGQSQTAKLVGHSAELVLPKYAYTSDDEGMCQAIETKKLYINKTLQPDIPMLIAPICWENTCVGMICIYEPAFERNTLFYHNLLVTVTALIASSLEMAYKHQSVAT